MVPTVLDVLGHRAAGDDPGRHPVAAPRRQLRPHLRRRRRPTSGHHTQYFEMLGHRAIYHDGWRAVCPWPGPSFAEAGIGVRAADLGRHARPSSTPTGWELYHVAEDFAENHNVADEHRDKLIELIGTWYVEAGKYDVLPIDGSGLAAHGGREAAQSPPPRDRYTYRPDTQSVPFFAGAAGAQPAAQHHRRRRDPRRRRRRRAALPGHRRRRLLVLRQGRQAALRPQLRRARASTASISEDGVPAGKHELRFEFEPTGEPDLPHGKGAPGRLQLYVDGDARRGRRGRRSRRRSSFNPGALTCGANPGSPVTPDYAGAVPRSPARCTASPSTSAAS